VKNKNGNLFISLALALVLYLGLILLGSQDLGAGYQGVGSRSGTLTYGYGNTVSTTTTTTLTTMTTPTPAGILQPATFKSSSLIINPSNVKPGEDVNIYVKITNTGDVAGTDRVVLKINNQIIESKDVPLASGTGTVVTFTTIGRLPGNYAVMVSGLNGDFTVSKSVTPPWFWLSAVAAFLLGVVLTAAFVFVKNRNN
jgi:CARDB